MSTQYFLKQTIGSEDNFEKLASKPELDQSSFHYNLSDSVENSFCDKLVVQASRQQKDQAELAVFKMLETAADDSSFCSNSSRIQGLVTAAVLQSPQRLPSVSPGLQNSKSFVK